MRFELQKIASYFLLESIEQKITYVGENPKPGSNEDCFEVGVAQDVTGQDKTAIFKSIFCSELTTALSLAEYKLRVSSIMIRGVHQCNFDG